MPQDPASYQESSVLRTIGGGAFDMATALTVENPFFTRRVGSIGWNPSKNPWLAKLNRLLAPGSDRLHRELDFMNRDPFDVARYRTPKVLRDPGKGFNRELRGVARSRTYIEGKHGLRGFDSVGKRGQMPLSGKMTALIGEPGMDPLERQVYRSKLDEMAGWRPWKKEGHWTRQLLGKGKSAATRSKAAMFGLGRVATRVNTALLVYEAARLAFKPVEILAEIGNQARAQPTQTFGPQIRTPDMARTLRQQAVAQMQSSAFGPRSMIGNESSFLHV